MTADPTPQQENPMNDPMPKVSGRCPACGRETLFLAVGGYPTCSIAECPAPTAASDVLELDHRHLVELREDGWSLEHPARCRVGGARLLDCPVDHATRKVCEAASAPPYKPGRYHVHLLDDDTLAWREVAR